MSQKVRRRYVNVPVIDQITVLFTALNTLLLAFFIALNSVAVVDPSRARMALGSLLGTFGGVPGGAQEVRTPGIVRGQIDQPTDEELEGVRRDIADLLAAHDAEGQVAVFTRGEDLVFRFEGRALFEEGTADVKPAARQVLAGLVQRISPTAHAIQIEGHVDTVSTRQSRYLSPWAYGAARAGAIHAELVAQGLAPGRLIVASGGCARPWMPNETEEQRSLNRRIEIVLVGGANDPRLYPRRQTVSIGGIEVELENTAAPASGERS